jgi:hypothetical protein
MISPDTPHEPCSDDRDWFGEISSALRLYERPLSYRIALADRTAAAHLLHARSLPASEPHARERAFTIATAWKRWAACERLEDLHEHHADHLPNDTLWRIQRDKLHYRTHAGANLNRLGLTSLRELLAPAILPAILELVPPPIPTRTRKTFQARKPRPDTLSGTGTDTGTDPRPNTGEPRQSKQAPEPQSKQTPQTKRNKRNSEG